MVLNGENVDVTDGNKTILLHKAADHFRQSGCVFIVGALEVNFQIQTCGKDVLGSIFMIWSIGREGEVGSSFVGNFVYEQVVWGDHPAYMLL